MGTPFSNANEYTMRAFVVVSSILAACRAGASLPLAAGYGYVELLPMPPTVLLPLLMPLMVSPLPMLTLPMLPPLLPMLPLLWLMLLPLWLRLLPWWLLPLL